ncbi:FAD-dependent oxidoreductase [Bacillus cereus]|uniref:FAD-dependent oxidoreductase n=1 Tax=Bacillus cereus TaxID=1396 RepID=UPI0015CF6308|nr:FAD-dependent oxidoreductase [Bacillus cereus]
MNYSELENHGTLIVNPNLSSKNNLTLYNEFKKVWNRAIQKKPTAILFINNETDIQFAIRWANKNNLSIRIRAGGHNYEGYCIDDNVLVIDISRLNAVTYPSAPRNNQVYYTYQRRIPFDSNNPQDPNKRLKEYTVNIADTFTIGGAALIKAVYMANIQNNTPFSGGTCPSVGATGFTLGGGWGLSTRYLGLGCDSLVAARMVDYKGDIIEVYDGSIVTVNRNGHRSNQPSDLFWALRGGGGGNFGVVTSLTFRKPSVYNYQRNIFEPITFPNQLYHFKILKEHVSQSDQIKFLKAAQNMYFEITDRRFSFQTSISNNRGQSGLSVSGVGIYYENTQLTDQQNFELINTYLQPIRNLGINVTLTRETPFNLFNGKLKNNTFEYFRSVGLMRNHRFNENEIHSLTQLIQNRPPQSRFIRLTLYTLGGTVKDLLSTDTAFPYREADFIVGLQTQWTANDSAQPNINWFNQEFKNLYPLTYGGFINFSNSIFGNNSNDSYVFMNTYYGENANRLKQVKKQIDPLNKFNFPQSIPLPI